MSPRLPVVSGADVVRALGKVGFSQIGQRGSHVKLANDAGRTTIVPMHRELAPGTLRSVLRQAGLTVEELVEFCRGQIATYKVPRYWRFVDEFPTTVTGKVQKYRMREVAITELGLQALAARNTA